MLCKLMQQKDAPEIDRGSHRISLLHGGIYGSGRKKDKGYERKAHQIKYTTGETKDLINHPTTLSKGI